MNTPNAKRERKKIQIAVIQLQASCTIIKANTLKMNEF